MTFHARRAGERDGYEGTEAANIKEVPQGESMKVQVKVSPYAKCATCGHPASDHPFGGRCSSLLFTEKCGCTAFVPEEPQVIKELRWIIHNLTNAETDAQRGKWREKLHKWGEAHPAEYRSLARDLIQRMELR
jgi:hypothetical protein